ncbi:MAG: aminotransferase [Clostridiales bacterium]|nr:aminotransferase [Clostridiales bacterium]
MKIKDFGVELYMNTYEDNCRYNLVETCVSSMTVNELLDLTGEKDRILSDILSFRLTYSHIEGSPGFKEGICSLYSGIKPENITTTHGAIGANSLAINALVEPGDDVVSVLPTYQQLYSIPESLGAKVKILPLNMENKYLPDLSLLGEFMNNNVKLICLNNPNNPSGSVMDKAFLTKLIEIVRPYGSYILVDETYRGLTHEGSNLTESIADLYEKGISTSSMSKTFSLAGLRIGWVAAAKDVVSLISKHRDYTTISCGVIDDYLAAAALAHKGKIFERNLKIVKDNIEILDNWVHSDPNFTYVRPKGGTTAFLKMNFDVPSMDFCLKLLEETGVIILPGSVMDTEGFIRIGYAFESEILKEGLEIISQFTKKLLSQQ